MAPGKKKKKILKRGGGWGPFFSLDRDKKIDASLFSDAAPQCKRLPEKWQNTKTNHRDKC